MFEIKFIGSGGHGVVVAGKILADAAAKSGHKSQSFASYGGLRRGGRVESFVRIDQKRILLHSKIYAADCVVLMDEGFAKSVDSVAGSVKKGGLILLNTGKPPSAFPHLLEYRLCTVDANRIAAENRLLMGSGMPVINTTMLGAIIGLIGLVRFEDLSQAIMEGGVPSAGNNVTAAKEAYVCIRKGDAAEAPILPGTTETVSAFFQSYPVFSPERCNRCGICWMYCPDVAIRFEGGHGKPTVDLGLCKGCGICAVECPRKAVSLRKG